MHPDDLIPIGLVGLGEGLVEQDAGIVDEDIGAAEMRDRIVEHRLSTGRRRDVRAVGDGFAPGRDDRIDHRLRHAFVRTRAVPRTTEIVDDDRCAFFRKEFSVGLTESAARARDDRNLTVEQTHDASPMPGPYGRS